MLQLSVETQLQFRAQGCVGASVASFGGVSAGELCIELFSKGACVCGACVCGAGAGTGGNARYIAFTQPVPQ